MESDIQYFYQASLKYQGDILNSEFPNSCNINFLDIIKWFRLLVCIHFTWMIEKLVWKQQVLVKYSVFRKWTMIS